MKTNLDIWVFIHDDVIKSQIKSYSVTYYNTS